MKFPKFSILIICNIYEIYSYIIFPLEYLANKNYKFIENQKIDDIIPENIMKQIYYKNLITKINIGTPNKEIILLIRINSDKFYISSANPSLNSTEKPQNFFQFSKDEFYNEKISSSYINGSCKINKYIFYPYDEICESNETINFNINNTNQKREYPISLVRNFDEKIPGYLGLLHSDLEFDNENYLMTNSKMRKLIDNYYWFFDFEEIDPLDRKLKGKLILGSKPQEIFPDKYSFEDLESTTSYKSSSTGRSWRLLIDKIYIDINTNNSIRIPGRIVTFNYEIYNIITTFEFHNIIKNLVMDEFIKEKKCFISNFTQNLYKNLNLSFYYCEKSTKNDLYEKIPNLKFKSIALNYIFEITKEELFYEKNDYIYFMILFANEPNTNWVIGQIFFKKYNFCFNTDNKQIVFYKKIYNETNKIDRNKFGDRGKKLSKGAVITFVAIGEALLFSFIGIIVGKLVFQEKKRKIRVNELENENSLGYNLNSDTSINYNNNFNNIANKNKIEKTNNIFKNQNEQIPIKVNKSIN